MSLGMFVHPAFSQEAAVQRVEVTGSSIKRLAAESSLPVTVIKADDFVKQGLTTAEQVVSSLASNQSSQGASQSVGASTGGVSLADLRGIGSNKTLILLNGRRIANHPYDGAAVDLNIIPISALQQVEV
ncbi:TonB-dependent receptor plug domain-containing protein [Undibacterium sp. GrIS 1.2]|uniref:TonB-dependent receptor plug domain-containing protein n=1 Tax=Undibacterium sp. GrIS 1.2 TaxID=3143933 RepID=UPI00339850A3